MCQSLSLNKVAALPVAVSAVWNLAGSRFGKQYYLNVVSPHNLAAITNEYKTVWGNLETPFLPWVIFNNELAHKQYNSVKNEIFQKRNTNRKKSQKVFF